MASKLPATKRNQARLSELPAPPGRSIFSAADIGAKMRDIADKVVQNVTNDAIRPR
jgi:hypothetical protein